MSALTFFAHGVPAPGGSKNVFPMWDRAGNLVCKTTATGRRMPILRVVDDAGDRNKRWKDAVAIQARSFMQGGKPFDCPLKCELIFFLKRPKNHFRTGKFSDVLREDAPREHAQAPDALKFARSTEDAMTGIVWVDDSQTTRICSEKRWCGPGDSEGCTVRIILLPSNPPRV